MLIPHAPSQNLHAPRRGRAVTPEDLNDVNITVVASLREPEQREPAVAKPSGRSAAINVRPIG